MNVIVANKYKEMLMGLDIEVMKSIEGVFNVDEIIDSFSNFFFDKMILDITSIRDYQNPDNLQKLAMNLDMNKIVLLLDDTPESETKTYLSLLISMGIYNFTRNADGIYYLLVHPHTYKDVVNIHNLQELEAELSKHESGGSGESVSGGTSYSRMQVIGIRNSTEHAGSSSLVYMMKKALESSYSVAAIEVNKMDFTFFNDTDMVSTTTNDLPKELMKKQTYDVVLVDLNDYDEDEICTQVLYLIEPSTIKINKMIKRNRHILEKLKDKKIVLNKSLLNDEDVATFEYETKLKVFFNMPPMDERSSDLIPVKKLLYKLGLIRR